MTEVGKYIKAELRNEAQRQLRLLRSARELRDSNANLDPAGEAYLKAAAVLSVFDPGSIKPLDRDRRPGEAARYLLSQSKPMTSRSSQSLWRLKRTARIRGLRAFSDTQAMREAIAQNPKRRKDSIQWAIETILSGERHEIHSLSIEQLVGLATAVSWFAPFVSELAEIYQQAELHAAIERARLFAPLRELIGNDFVGREKELRDLSQYVGVLPARSLPAALGAFFADVWYGLIDHPPLFIHGPGGVGKSALIAKFILEHVDSSSNTVLPIIYLDADRPGIVADQPMTLLVEAALQLGSQFPATGAQAQVFAEDLIAALDREDASEGSKTSLSRSQFAERFAEILTIASPEKGPVLFVIDTFEEVQFLGEEIVKGLWHFLDLLQEAAPQLRIVVAGRVTTPQFGGNERELREFDRPISYTYLNRKLSEHEISDPDGVLAERIVSVVGGNPLCLNLAARLVAQAGPDELRKIRTRRGFFKRLKAEKIQAQLYLRILGHIHTDNKDIRKLAHPGLIVRRIDAGVIRKVLAGPCKLSLGDGLEDDLLEKLENEIALVFRDPDDQALRHRTDVRRMMLPLIEEEHANVAAQIDANAVAYYETLDGPIPRAEEIYHRLRLKQKTSKIDARWEPGVAKHLANAIEELEPMQQVYLSQKLGVTPERALLEKADLHSWEQITARKVRRLHRSGRIETALGELRERLERTPSSPLYELECETLRKLRMFEEGAFVAQRGLDSAIDAGDHALEIEMQRQLSLSHEGLGQFERALEDINAADVSLVQKSADDAIPMLQVAVVKIRLLRKMGLELEQKALVEQISQLVIDELNHIASHPALFRELVAELGGDDLDILKTGIESVGVEVLSDEHAGNLAKTMAHWDSRVASTNSTSTISRSAKIDEEVASTDQWKEWIQKNTGSRLDRTVTNALNKFTIDKVDQTALAEHFQSAVETILLGPTRK